MAHSEQLEHLLKQKIIQTYTNVNAYGVSLQTEYKFDQATFMRYTLS